MACYHPLPAWWAKKRNENGKRGVVFNLDAGDVRRPLEVPCGRCVGCQLERSRQWAVRCMHEAKLYDCNEFATLTYETVPPGGSLEPRDFTLFMKRLRIVHSGVRYFQCGEYGEQLSRPHHHAILFNCHFSDRRYLKSKNGIDLFTSKELDDLWGLGQCTIGNVTFESAAYVARYAMKKVNSEAHYAGRVPEYCTMSRRPGIGRDFVVKYKKDIYPSDMVVVRGVACRPPRYYDNVLEKESRRSYVYVKAARQRMQAEEIERVGGEVENAKRLKRAEVVKKAAIRALTREIER